MMIGTKKWFFIFQKVSNSGRYVTGPYIKLLLEKNINKIVTHCLSKKETIYTPSDFPLTNLTISQLNSILEKDIAENKFLELYPTSPMQQGFIYHKLLTPDTDNYYVQVNLKLTGKLEPEILQQAWQIITDKYSILRTGFTYKYSSQPLQFVTNKAQLPWQNFNWSQHSQVRRKQKLDEFLRTDRQQRFKLNNPPLLRCSLINFDENEYRLIVGYHHILFDGWSFFKMLQEILNLYEKLITDTPYQLHIPPRFSSYIDWLQSQDKNQAKQYWSKLLKGFDTPSHLSFLPNYNNDNEISTNSYDNITRKISRRQTIKIRALARNNNLTLNTVLQGALGILLGRYCSSDDIVFGHVVSGRTAKVDQIEKIVGITINTLPVRIILNKNISIINYLTKLQSQLAKSQQYDYLSLAEIQNCSSINNNTDLFSVISIYENYPKPEFKLKKIKIANLEIIEKTHYPFTLTIFDDENIHIKISYNANKFHLRHVEQFIDHLLIVVDNIIRKPNFGINDINILSKHEFYIFKKHQIIKHSKINKNQYLTHLFEKMVKRNPRKIAVNDLHEKIDYLTLNEHSNRLARCLAAKGIKANSLIAVCFSRGVEYITTTLAILKLGATYLPIDPETPLIRKQGILSQAQPELIITSIKHKITFSRINHATINIENLLSIAKTYKSDNLNLKIKPTSAAYIIYTSGSTGVPNGVVVSIRSLTNFLIAMSNHLCINDKDIFLALTPFTFDISNLELFLPLITGASTVIADEEAQHNGKKLRQIIDENAVNIIQATPTSWQIILDQDWSNDQNAKLLCGGEPLPKKLAKKLFQLSDEVFNLYGPTETTIWSTYHKIKFSDLAHSIIPIGKPIDNNSIYVLDQNMQPTPINIAGEIYIGGNNLALGYLKNKKLTSERFIPNPFIKLSDHKIYKTGDYGYWNENHELEFLARKDEQVKLNGFRIELHEIELCIEQLPTIKQSIVIPIKSKRNTFLYAFILIKKSKKKNNVSITKLRSFLGEHLPSYMIPNHFIFVNQFPLTPNNKIDKKELQQYTKQQTKHQQIKPQQKKQPLSRTATIISNIWVNLLNLPYSYLNYHDDFFLLGGNSITAIQMLNKVELEFKINISFKTIIESSRLIELTKIIDEHVEKAKQRQTLLKQKSLETSAQCLITLNANDNSINPPIFLFHPIGGTVFCYTALANSLCINHPIIGIQDPGIPQSSLLFENFTEMASYYVKVIQQYQPQGPYYLMGASFGSNMAVEVARQLTIEGNTIHFLGSIDGWAIYPAKVNNDFEWFKQNLQRQHETLVTNNQDTMFIDFLIELNWHRQQLLANHKTVKWDFDLVLFKSAIVSPVLQPINAKYNHWDNLSDKPIKVYTTPGDHESILQPPHVKKLAEKLQKSLT